MVRTKDPQRREQILDSALALFAGQGVQNTTTAELSKAAGIAAGTLFLYFPSKQALIDALALRAAAQQAQAASERLAGAASAQEAFAAIWYATIDYFLAYPAAFRFLVQVRDSGWISEETVQETAAMFAYFYHAVQMGLDENTIAPYPPDLIGSLLYHAIVAVVNIAQSQPQAQAQQTIDQGFAIFWKGIQP